MAVGNVVGSNIFNILGIIGTTAIVQPIDVPAQIIVFDIWVVLGAAILAVVFAITGWTVKRWEGIILLLGYGAYTAILFSPPARAALSLP